MRYLLLALLLVTLTCTATAQALPITKKQYEDVIVTAEVKAKQLLHRSLKETTSYRSGKVTNRLETMVESFPNGDKREVTNFTIDGKPAWRTEIIYLGNFEYRKKDENAWTKACYKNCSEVTMTISSIDERKIPKLEGYLMSVPTDKSEKVIGFFLYRVTDQGDTLDFLDSKASIGGKGLLQRKVETFSQMYPENITSVEVTKYQYEPTDILPLKAPID